MAGFTKKAIVDTFVELLNEKPLAKITVTELITRCGINRNTFYYHFSDIYALVDELLGSEIQRFSKRLDRSLSLQESLIAAMAFITKYEKAIRNINNSGNREQVQRFVFEAVEEVTQEFTRKMAEGTGATEEDIRFIARYTTYAFAGLVSDWLASDDNESLAFMIGRVSQLTEDAIREFLGHLVRTFRQLEEEP